MSTILKTLKKLEEEKSILEKKLDLKELVLQDKDSFDIDSSISKKLLWKSFLLLLALHASYQLDLHQILQQSRLHDMEILSMP